ncbi:MAG TPA: GntR family transcriptional regulator [Usitatibacter sp.]|jgi:GntR family transcriptional regulator|nr:GntR family transcriptional regulator [Usitatibacter sp.]
MPRPRAARSPILYQRIADELAAQIRSKRLAAFAKLPSEAELIERFGVSRVTVRQALRKLAQAGLVISRQGKGVFVAGAVVNQELTALRGFYDNLVMQGHDPDSTVLRFECRRSSASAPELQRLEHDVYCFRRLWRIGDLPLAVADASIPGGGKEVRREDVERLPVYSIVREVIRREVIRASVQVRAAKCAADIAKLLKIASGETILEMERISYDRQGLAVELTRFSVPPELFAFQMEVAGPMQIASSIKRVAPASRETNRGKAR